MSPPTEDLSSFTLARGRTHECAQERRERDEQERCCRDRNDKREGHGHLVAMTMQAMTIPMIQTARLPMTISVSVFRL
jgi:hypothetical protein